MGGFYSFAFISMKNANYFIYDPFNLGWDAKWAIDMELRDYECNRQDFTVLISSPDYLTKDLEKKMHWKIKACSDPYELKNK